MHVFASQTQPKSDESTLGERCSVNSKLYLHKQIFGDAGKSLLSFHWALLADFAECWLVYVFAAAVVLAKVLKFILQFNFV